MKIIALWLHEKNYVRSLIELNDREIKKNVIGQFIHEVCKTAGMGYQKPALIFITAGIKSSLFTKNCILNFFKDNTFRCIRDCFDATLKISSKYIFERIF